MEVAEGRGMHTKIIAAKNKRNVKLWFQENPNSTKKECCDGLCLTYVTVRKHLKSLKDE